MTQRITAVALIVPDYDAAIRFFCDVLGFRLIDDVDQGLSDVVFRGHESTTS